MSDESTSKAPRTLADLDLSQEDYHAIQDVLLAELHRGTDNPLLPTDVDLDGDGIVESFGLDEDGDLILVMSELSATIYVSDGDDIGPEVSA